MDLETRTGTLTRAGLLAAGWQEAELRRLLSGDRLVPVRPGVYVPGDDERLLSERARHLLRVRAAADAMSDQAVVSHVSAGVLHGLVMWGVDLSRVEVTRSRAGGGRLAPGVHVVPSPLRADEVVRVGGVAVTTPSRTVVDLARRLSFAKGVVVADAALREGVVTRAGLREAVDRARGWRGVPRARRVVAFADGRSESVGESRSRVAIVRAGLPVPRPQVDVVDPTHLLVGRCDFGWDGRRTVGEFDGRIKYGRVLQPDQDPGEVVFAEKLREDALREQGLEVVRWVWSELRDFGPVEARIRRAFARASRFR